VTGNVRPIGESKEGGEREGGNTMSRGTPKKKRKEKRNVIAEI